MALAINIMHGRGPSNEMRLKLQPQLYIANKIERFSFIVAKVFLVKQKTNLEGCRIP